MKRTLILLGMLASCGVIHDGGSPGWTPVEPQVEATQPPVEDPPKIPATPASCEGKVAFELAENALWITAMDGTRTVVHRFGRMWSHVPESVYISDWIQEGDSHLFLATSSYGFHDFIHEGLLVGSDGTVKRSWVISDAFVRTHLAANGDLTFDVWNGESTVVQANGVRFGLGNFHPMAAPLQNFVFARDRPRGDERDVSFGWLDYESMHFVPASIQPTNHPAIHHLGDKLAYIGEGNQFVVTSPEGAKSVAIPFEHTNQIFRITETSTDRRHMIVTDYNHWYAINVDDLSVLEIPIKEDWRHHPIGIRNDGAILATEPLEDRLQAVVSTDSGMTWQRVGESYVPREGFGLTVWQRHAGGNALLLGVTMGYGFFLDSVQAISGGDGVVQLDGRGLYMYNGSGIVDLSPDGGCALIWRLAVGSRNFNPEPLELVMVDFSTGKSSVLREGDSYTQTRFVR